MVFFGGFSTWTVAMVLLAVDSEYQVRGLVIVLSMLVGIGTGSSFQNSVMAISAQADKETKGLAVGTRNVLRSFGGALGTAVSSFILQERLRVGLPEDFSATFHPADSAFAHEPFERLSRPERDQVKEAYDGAIMWVFFASAIFVGVCFLLCPLIRDERARPVPDGEQLEVREERQHAGEVDEDDAKSALGEVQVVEVELRAGR